MGRGLSVDDAGGGIISRRFQNHQDQHRTSQRGLELPDKDIHFVGIYHWTRTHIIM